MRIISFNVNGMKSIHGKGKNGEKDCFANENVLTKLIHEQKPDILCLQETRCQTTKELESYGFENIYTSFADKKGYSGTAILTKQKPISVTNFNGPLLTNEGRMIVAEYDTFIVVNVYTPNSKDELLRLDERLIWDMNFCTYLKQFTKPIIACGDFNCASEDIDIHNPKIHRKCAGFSDEERKSFHALCNDVKLVDTFRYLHPHTVKYSYWSNFFQSRSKNRGWRIDYVLCSSSLPIVNADILTEYFGSDHCPIIADIVMNTLQE